jgi:hypothetical protein
VTAVWVIEEIDEAGAKMLAICATETRALVVMDAYYGQGIVVYTRKVDMVGTVEVVKRWTITDRGLTGKPWARSIGLTPLRSAILPIDPHPPRAHTKTRGLSNGSLRVNTVGYDQSEMMKQHAEVIAMIEKSDPEHDLSEMTWLIP